MDNAILDEQQFENKILRRRDLLPVWIKVFTWIFLIFGAMAPIIFIMGIIGFNFNLSLYGLETMEPLSIIGILITILFGFKGIVSFGLWTEKEWAVNMAIIDAAFGIFICVLVMIVLPFFASGNGFHLDLRLELIALIPYLIKMQNIESEWSERIALKN